MKKLLPLFLVLVLALCVLASCQLPELPPPEDDGTGTVNPGENPGEQPGENPGENPGEQPGENPGEQPGENPTPEVDEDLQAAYDYIKLTYKTLNLTSASFEVMKNAPIGEKIFAITWSVDNAAITITETEDGSFYVVNVPELGAQAVNYTLSFSIQNDKGEKKEGSFSLTIPAYKVNTFDEYVAAEDGELLVIQGIVTGVISKTTNSTKENSLFIQDLNGNGGYYAYNLEEDPNGVIKVGMTVEVSGNKKNYNGTFELTNPVATIIDETIKTVTPVDFTEVLASAAGLDADELVKKNGMLVTIKGVTLLEYNEGNGYHYFKLGNHKAYLRVSSSSNCITKDEGKTLTQTFLDNFYNIADVTGIVAVYNGDFYLMPASVNAFENFVEQEKPADIKVDIALENTKVPGMIQLAGDTELPTTFSGFSDVTISWELVSGACATLSGNKLTVTIPTAAEEVVVKATAVCGDVSDSKEFTITVKPISTITIEEANNIGMMMTHNTYTEELYYIVGTVESIANSTYGNLYLIDGDFSIYVYGMYDATGKVSYDSMDPQPLPKDVVKVLSAVGKYSNDVQLKNAKVIEHTVHEDNKVEVAPTIDFKPVNPIVGSQFFFGMTKNNAVYYITGAMATGNASHFMASTAKQANTVKITVIAGPTADTYYITLTVDGTVKYMDVVLNGTYKNAVYVDAAPAVGFSFDPELKVFYKELDGSNYTFGTALSNPYTTIGGVKVSADNAMLQISFAAEHVCEFTDAVTAPDCENAGYTTHTCACGNVVVDSEVPALEHDWDEEGNCTRDNCDATNHEHVYDEVVTAPTCEAGGYTTYSCTVEGCHKSYTDNATEALGHAYTNGVCANGCGVDEPGYYYSMSITDALAAADGKLVEIVGSVINIGTPYDEGFGNISLTIADANGTEIYLFRLKGNYALHDTIVVKGTMATYKGARQIAQGATATKTGVAECTWTEATCKDLATCTICGATTGDYADHTFADGVCTVCGAQDHVHVYDAVVTAPTCDAAGYTTYTCGCGDSYTEAGDAALGHDYANGSCTVCGAEDPDYYYPMSITEALSAPVGKKVLLTGTISAIKSEWDTGYKNMEAYLSDGDGNQILLYRIKTQVSVGDKITVQGAIGVYNEVNQIAQGTSTVTITEKHVCSQYTEATCTERAKCVICGTATGELAEHTMVNGVCSACGHKEGEAEIVELSLSFADKANRTSQTTSQQVWEQNGITLTNDKGSSTSNVADYANPARFYKSSKLTIEVDGKQITKIVFTCSEPKYTTPLQSSITAADGGTVSVSGNVITVEFATPVDSYVIASLTGGQVRMNSLVVYAR